ncbi:MAG: ribosome silencing factor [Caldisericia bacterium]
MARTKKNRILKLIYDSIKEKKGDEILCLDVRKNTYLFDYLFICSVDSDIQAKAIVENIYIKVKKEFGRSPQSIDGEEKGAWVVIDYGDIIIHIFNVIKRMYYNLENIWIDSKAVDLED